ncbi:MAG: hypothetical protein ACTHYO_03835 [Micrococcaceae bacterium]
MSVVLDSPRTADFDTPPDLDEGVDPVIAKARAAGRLAGERLARTPLTPRQRAAVASVMGGDR